MSYHHLTAKPLNATLNAILKRAAHVGLGVGAFTPMLALANPTGGQVVAGQANISTPNANNLVVKQASQSAIINWQQFNIGSGQYVQFLQPSSSSVVLNRVVGGNATSILGNLSANGQVFLVNPNGIFFGKGATLDVQGIVASTLDISNSDFMAGNYLFDKGSAPDGASVVNQGNIHTRNGGYVVLAGDYSENDGLIQAKSGHVVLASGAKTTLTLSGNRFVNFAVDGATLSQLAGAKNAGSLLADGGTVIMTADVANQLKATVVNNTGLIEAHAITKGGGGIYLSAEGGNLVNAGTLDADAGRAGMAGGTIQLKGDGVTNLTATSKISALGNGADGGHLEVSGQTINVRGKANLGRGGNLLLDPTSVELVAGSATSARSVGKGTSSGTVALGKVGVGFLETQLNAGANVAVSAHTKIYNSASVNAITATGAGNLSFKTAAGGQIALSGVDITIAGGLTASFGKGSFGFIQAKSVALNASSHGSIGLAGVSASSHGGVTKYSIKATGGDVTVTGGPKIYRNGGSGVFAAIKAKGNVNLGSAHVGNSSSAAEMGLTIVGKTVTDTGLIHDGDGINITASNGALTLGEVWTIGSVNLAATGGNLAATHVYGNNGVTITDNGGTVTAEDVDASNGSINITDTTGNVKLATLHGSKNVTVNAKGHALNFSGGYGFAGSNLTLTAATITGSGGSSNFALTAQHGDLTVRGQISLTSNHSAGTAHLQTPHNLGLDASGTITLNRSIAVPGSVDIVGGHLAYIGGNSFTVSAADGNLYLEASIGSSAAAAKYNVNLKDKGTAHGGAIFIQKDIYTGTTAGGLKANITATETGYGSGAPVAGVLVGNSYGGSEVVSAAGNITLKGWNAAAGGNIPSISGIGAVTLKAGGNITFSASGNGSKGGNAAIQASNAAVSGSGGYKDNTSVLVQAGGNIKLSGEKVVVQAGRANVSLSVSHGYGTASANVSLIAGNNVTLVGGKDSHGRVTVDAGYGVSAGLSNAAYGGQTLTEQAFGNVSITARNNISVSANRVHVNNGFANARASAGEGSASMTALASAGVSLKAKRGSLTLTGGVSYGNAGVYIGNSSGSSNVQSVGKFGGAFANGGSLKAAATTHTDLSLTAGNAITLSGHYVKVETGYGVGKTTQSGSNKTMITQATGSHASASDTVTSNITLNAGAGGITLTGLGTHAGVSVEGGGGLGDNASVSAAGNATKANETVNAKVTLTTTGNVTVTAVSGISMAGGTSAARATRVAASYGSAAINDNNSMDVSAANVIIGGGAGNSNYVHLVGGAAAIGEASATAKDGGVATTTGMGRLDINATGNVMLLGARSVAITGAGSMGRSDHVHASNGGSATISGDAGVGIVGGGVVKVVSTNDSVAITGNNRAFAGWSASVAARSGGKANLSALDNVSLQGGTVKLGAANGNISVSAGFGVANAAHVSASNGQAALNAQNNVSLAGGAGGIIMTAKNAINVRGGDAARGNSSRTNSTSSNRQISASGSNSRNEHIVKHFYDVTSVRAGGNGSAQLTGSAAVSLTTTKGGVITLTQTNTSSGRISIAGGASVAGSAVAAADGDATATLTAKGGVTINGGAVTLTGRSVEVVAGKFTAAGRNAHSSHSFFGKSSGSPYSGSSSGSGVIRHLPVQAMGIGAKAALNADASVSITGTAVSLNAANEAFVSAGYGAALNGYASAGSGGSAALTAKSQVNLTATTGALTMNADSIGIGASHCCGSTIGREDAAAGALAAATRGTATVSVDGGIALSGKTAVTLTAGSGVVITAASGPSHAGASAGFKGQASVTDNLQTSIVTSGAFTAVAGSGVFVHAGRAWGGGSTSPSNSSVLQIGPNYAHASGAGATATFSSNGSLNINAGSVKLKAGRTLGLIGGSHAGDYGVTRASYGGAANYNANRDVNVTAVSGVLAKLTPNASSSGGEIFVVGGSYAGDGAKVIAGPNGGTASLTASAGINITVTHGGVALNAGTHKDGGLHVAAGDYAGGYSSRRSHSAGMTQAGGRGASANAMISSNLDITATGSISMIAGASGSMSVKGGANAALSAPVSAAGGGKATRTITSQTSLNGGSVTLTAGHNITITAASVTGYSAGVTASSGGVAKLSLTTGTQITAKAGFTATAGGRVRIDASGSSFSNMAGRSAGVAAVGGRAQATMTVADATRINAGSVNVNAGTSLDIYGGWEVGDSAHVHADTRNDVATMNLDGSLDITAVGAISLTAKTGLNVSGGGSAGRSAGISIGTSPGSHVKATGILNVDAGVNLKAGGAFTAVGSIVHFGNGSSIGNSFHAGAFGPADVAKASLTDGVSVSAANITLAGANGVTLQVGSLAARNGGGFAVSGGKATVTATDAISLNAIGNVFIVTNTGDVDVSGGRGSFNNAPVGATALGFGATATVTVQGGVDITAGGNLKLNAKRGGVQVEGGNGVFGSANAISGSASLSVNAGVDLKAGRSMIVNAGGGSIALLGGGAAGLVANQRSFGPPSPGNVTGTLTTGVNATAGSNVTLQATRSVTVAAGAGETVAVGKMRLFSASGSHTSGASWGGGTTILSEDQSATVTAGKLLTVTAGAGTGGSGNIVVRALGRNPGESSGFYNIVSVRGGSSGAFASVNVNANAELTGGSVMLNAARVSTVTGPSHQGNLSIDGGSFYNLRADHTKGTVTITGNANAGITAATGNVMLNAIGGSVNVAGGGYSDSSRYRLVDAHGDSGSASVTGHADATITAAHDIVTVNALGGGLNVTAGKLLAVVAVGSAGHAALQEATGTVDAGLTAGDVINLSGAGDINLVGGLLGEASASVASASLARRSANLEMTTTVSGANGVSLVFNGDGVLAAGDNVVAKGVASAALSSLNATADASTSVTGKNITLKVGGNLLVRAGGSDSVGGIVSGLSNSFTATTKANLNLTATGNVFVAAGFVTHAATASFVAGNVPTAHLEVYGGKYGPSPGSVTFSSGGNRATGNLNADLNVTAGGAITLNIHGNLAVAGGQAVGASANVLAGQPYSFGSVKKFTGDNGVATAIISSKTTFKSGGNTSITLHGGTVTLAGGYQAASNAVVDAAVTSDGGTAAKSALTLNESLSMTAGGALAITGAALTSTGVVVSTQVPSTSSFGPFLFPLGSHATANVKGDSTVTLSGKTLSINGGHFSTQSAGTHGYSSPAGGTTGSGAKYGPNSVFLDGRIHLLQNGLPLMSVASPLSVSVHTLDITRRTLEVVPQHTATSFGVPVSLSSLPGASPLNGTAPQASVKGSTVTQATDGALGTLQSTGLVVNLVSVAAGGAASVSNVSNQATAFDPALSLVPTAAGSGTACTAFVPQSSGGYRCGSGGR